MAASEKNQIHVAIIGGGITGVTLALGLQKRGVDYTLYERADGFAEIGAGIGFSPNAERALGVVDPEVYRIYKQITPTSTEEEWFQWIDGYETNEIVARLLIGVDAFKGGRRSDFVEAWSKLIPSDKVRFGKEVVSATQRKDGKVSLQFKDGTTEEADIVIGCDGINSRVRKLILGDANPASYPSYTGKYCYRALVPMDKARAVLGDDRTLGRGKSMNRYMYVGPNTHLVNYAVAKDQALNLLFVMSDADPWRTDDGKHTAPGDKADVVTAYADWHPSVRALVDLLPEQLQKWAIFDMYDNPAPHYHSGSMAIAGDAAHAAGPHLGSGAGFGIEDALVLASLLEGVNAKLGQPGQRQRQQGKTELCRAALATYNNVRYERTQWLVGATRDACAMFHRQDREVGGDYDKLMLGIGKLFYNIWDNDIDQMVRDALEEYDAVLGSGTWTS
ncbi:FAD/NAD(P)-binding domain-containing protein [Hypoxylon sp. NC1633]|nr:FAD/NAD(P)-binding domain-containing protein [Hypoxylon sp. NC1633]